jgi:CBS domain containing-hemolysin-like protein
VIDHGQPVGVITRSDVATALAHAGPEATVASAPHHTVVTVSPAESLDLVLEKLREQPDSVALVVDEGEPVGVLTPEHLAAYVALHGKEGRLGGGPHAVYQRTPITRTVAGRIVR